MIPVAAPPPAETPAPAELLRALEEFGLGDAGLRPVWQNAVGGLTFAVASPGPGREADFYAKWNPLDSGESLVVEAERLTWMRGRHPVSEVIAFSADASAEVLLTRALPGESAVAERWRQDPETALRALGAGLRRLHEVPIDDCPFTWDLEYRFAIAGLDRRSVGDAPSVDRLVLCQGDPCAPNTLLAVDGSFLAHVDLARLGVADRWADLAVMTMSLEWNYREYDERIFWDAYGIDPDPPRIDFYRKLWNAE